jgi:hypothetical protein
LIDFLSTVAIFFKQPICNLRASLPSGSSVRSSERIPFVTFRKGGLLKNVFPSATIKKVLAKFTFWQIAVHYFFIGTKQRNGTIAFLLFYVFLEIVLTKPVSFLHFPLFFLPPRSISVFECCTQTDRAQKKKKISDQKIAPFCRKQPSFRNRFLHPVVQTGNTIGTVTNAVKEDSSSRKKKQKNGQDRGGGCSRV